MIVHDPPKVLIQWYDVKDLAIIIVKQFSLLWDLWFVVVILNSLLFNVQNVFYLNILHTSSFPPLCALIHLLRFFLHPMFSWIVQTLEYPFLTLRFRPLSYGNSFHLVWFWWFPFWLYIYWVTSKLISLPFKDAGLDVPKL